MADHRIGKIFVELDLDADRYTKGQQRLLKDATQTALNIEQNFKNLGIKSSAEMDLMRAKIMNSYNMITNNAKASANDILRAEQAKNDQLKRLNDQQFGAQTSLMDNLKKNWLAYSATVYAAMRILSQAWDMAKEGAGYREQMGVLDNLSRKYGTSSVEIVDSMRRASDGLVADSDLMQVALEGIGKGLKPEQLKNLADAARILSDVVGTDATTALNDLTQALETGRTKGLKNYLGTAIDLEKTFGDLTSKLTEAEKAQALYNIVMIETTKMQAEQTTKVDGTADAIERLEAKWKNLKKMVSESLASGIGVFIGSAEQDEQAKLARTRLAYMKGNQNIDYASLSKMSMKDQNAYLDSQIKAQSQGMADAQSNSVLAGKSVSPYQADLDKLKNQVAARDAAEKAAKKPLKLSDNWMVDAWKAEDKYNEESRQSAEAILWKQRVTAGLVQEQDILIDQQQSLFIGYDSQALKMQQLADEMIDANQTALKMTSSFDGVKMAIEASSGALADFVVTGKMDMKSFADSVIRDFVRIQIQQSLLYAATGGKEGSTGWIGGALKLVGGLLGSAKGNAFDAGRVTPFAMGGVYNKPTLFPMATGMGLMGEAGPEAVMPLTRGSDGKLGVKAKGGDGNGEGATNIFIQAVDAKSFEDLCKRNPGAITGPILQSLRDNKTRTEFKRLVN